MSLREADAPAAGRALTSGAMGGNDLGVVAIRDFRSSDSIPALTKLLRDAYAELGRLGFRYLATHQDEAMTARRLGRGYPLVAYVDGSLVGTATLFPPRPDSPVPWYRGPGVWHFGQLGVRPDLHKLGIGTALLRELEARARGRGAAELACDTAEGAAHLRAWYDREGFRFIGTTQWAITNYRSVVLSKTLS